MKNGYSNIITSRWLRSFSLLVFVYFCQADPGYHLHHSHEEGTFAFEISSHPVDVDVEHSSDHHHDEDRPHTNSHQHTYDKQIGWHLIRTQNSIPVTPDDQSSFSSIPLIFADENNSSVFDSKEPLLENQYEASSFIIRGPPFVA